MKLLEIGIAREQDKDVSRVLRQDFEPCTMRRVPVNGWGGCRRDARTGVQGDGLSGRHPRRLAI